MEIANMSLHKWPFPRKTLRCTYCGGWQTLSQSVNITILAAIQVLLHTHITYILQTHTYICISIYSYRYM